MHTFESEDSGRITIGCRVPSDVAERLRQAAAREDRSIASFIRRAVLRELALHSSEAGDASSMVVD